MKAEFVLILFTLPSAVLAQTRQPPKPDSLLYRTRKGDDSALSEMEKSSDVQDLQTLLHAPNYSGKSATPIFLAKMGDHEALQYFAGQSLTKRKCPVFPRVNHSPILKPEPQAPSFLQDHRNAPSAGQ